MAGPNNAGIIVPPVPIGGGQDSSGGAQMTFLPPVPLFSGAGADTQQSISHGTGTSVPGTTTPPTNTPPNNLPPYLQPPPTTTGNITVGGPAQIQQRYIDVVDDCMRSVSVVNPPHNSYIDVFVNGVWRGSAIAYDNVVDVPIAVCSLKVGALIQIHFDGLTTNLSTRVVSHVPYSVLTQHYDNARTGWNPYETQLTTSNVPKLDPTGLFQMLEVDGKDLEGQIYAQPLYMHKQYFPAKGAAFNVVFVATEMNRVYAFDADDTHQGEEYPYLWKNVLMPVGNELVTPEDVSGRNVLDAPDTYQNIAPYIGITGTPVIRCGCGCGCDDDCNCCSTPTLYVVTKSKRLTRVGYTFHIYLHALDVITGVERPNSPVEITGKVPGTGGGGTNPKITDSDGKGNVLFVAQWHLQRPGLLLLDGVVYIAFGSHNDSEPTVYHGWIMGYDADTLEQKSIFCTTPNNSQSSPPFQGGGSIWMGGMGLASDGDAIYCTTGNGKFDADSGGSNYGNSVLKLSKDLQVISWFTPSYQADLNHNDIDLGSGGVTIIPSMPWMPKLLIFCGKDGNVLLLSRDNLGGYSGPTRFPPVPAEPPGPVDWSGGTPVNSSNSNINAVDSILIPPGYYQDLFTEPYNTPGVWGGTSIF